MCNYTDKVHKCGHYSRSCDPCDKAKKAKSLCDPPVLEKKKRGSAGSKNTSYTRVAGRDLDQVAICTTEFDNSGYSYLNNHHACAQEPKRAEADKRIEKTL